MPHSPLRRAVLGSGVAALVAPALLRAAPDRWRTLEASLTRLAGSVDGKLGVCVRDLNDGGTLSIHGSERFAMHSTVKMIVTASVAERIARGEIGLQQIVTVPSVGRPGGPGSIDKALAARGDQQVGVLALMEATMLESDNAACDALLALLGGPQTVDADLRRWGLAGIRTERTMAQTYLPFDGSADARRAAYAALMKDPGNHATPDAYAEFTVRLVNGRLLAPAATPLVTDLFTRSRLGADRLTAGLGEGWTVASRTGGGPTVDGRCSGTHHVAFATAPGRRLVIAAFLGNAAGDAAKRNAVLADVGRGVRDAWRA